MVTAHLLDSLSALPYIRGNNILDVGSGAGLPGFPLAIVCPALAVTLLESRKKKTMFLNNVVGSMAPGNVEVVCQRVEQYRPPRKFDTLVTRAFSTLATFAESSAHLCAPGGRLIAMKGRFPEAELAEIDQSQFEVTEVCPVSVPGLDAKRHLVVLNPS
jgi:16S rRNA (guanine527-N7)-methyltransferase